MTKEMDKPTGADLRQQTTDRPALLEEKRAAASDVALADKSPQTAVKSTKKKNKTKRGKLPTWARITLRILRLLLVPILCIIALFGGLTVGYVYIGGQEMGDVWKFETWRYVFDLMFKDT